LKTQQEKLITKHSKHLKNLKNRYGKLNARITKAFNNPSGHGLASDEEKEQLAAFNNMSESIAKLSKKSSIDSAKYQQRLARIQGVLYWNLSQRYDNRRQDVSKSLTLLQASIKKLTKQLDASKFAYQVAPKGYQGFNRKISKLKHKYQLQLSKLDVVYHRQRERVGGIVKTDIKVRQDRVMGYQLQARLAAARLFDETSNKVRSVATGEVRQ
jgi:BMFP domain-containing protein YqiC